jgi:protein phosphatase
MRTADEAIWAHAHTHHNLQGMGTTVVLALCQAAQVHVAHVGDSRVYLLHHSEFRQLTEDHSVVAQLIKEGRITPRRARTHPLRHQITRSLGSREAVADLLCTTWQARDCLLLCSDGLINMVEDRHIKELILQAGRDVAAACEALVARANANGGEDNISVVLAYNDSVHPYGQSWSNFCAIRVSSETGMAGATGDICPFAVTSQEERIGG